MYEKFYHFSGMPFQLTPDSRFFFSSKGHSRAIAHLIYGLSQGEGFIIVTGEVGAGKTTLVERLWSELDRGTYTLARISTTQVSGEDLFRLTMAAFGIETEGLDKAGMLARFEEMLTDHRIEGRHCILVVDEAQNLSLAGLEELRMLSNLTEGGRAALQTILLGQPQFRAKLASPDLDQLRQRVAYSLSQIFVISDNNMPKMTGLQALTHLRADDRWKDLPVIICSGRTEVANEVIALGGIFADKGSSDLLRLVTTMSETLGTKDPE